MSKLDRLFTGAVLFITFSMYGSAAVAPHLPAWMRPANSQTETPTEVTPAGVDDWDLTHSH